MGIVTRMESCTLKFTIRELRSCTSVHRIIYSYLPTSIVNYNYFEFVYIIIYDAEDIEHTSAYDMGPHPIAYEICSVEWDRVNWCFRTIYLEEVFENGELSIKKELYELFP